LPPSYYLQLTDFIKVERIFSWDGAIQSGLQIGGPILDQYVLATRVSFAHTSYSGVHILATVHVLHGRLSEEEVHILPNVE